MHNTTEYTAKSLSNKYQYLFYTIIYPIIGPTTFQSRCRLKDHFSLQKNHDLIIVLIKPKLTKKFPSPSSNSIRPFLLSSHTIKNYNTSSKCPHQDPQALGHSFFSICPKYIMSAHWLPPIVYVVLNMKFVIV